MLESIELKILDSRLGKSIELPHYATNGSAAMDLRAVFDENERIIKPNESLLIGTGLAIYIKNEHYAAYILPRSGLGHKHGIILGNSIGLIDSDYQGELKISCWNRSDEPYTIQLGDRIAQLIITPVVRPKLTIVDAFNTTERGSSGFGHTGTQ